MNIGYARVSTRDQNLELQIDALKKENSEEIFSEKQSAVKERPELEKMISMLRKGDVVIVWKLDRLGRSLKHLIDLVAMFREKGRIGGRKPGLSKSAINKAHAALHFSKQDMPVREILEQLDISKSTYYRYLEYAKSDYSIRKVRNTS